MKRAVYPVSFPLIALCTGAIYGKGAEVIAGIGCVMAILSMLRDGMAPRDRATTWVFWVFAGYFLFFTLHDSIFTGHPLASFLEMRVNLPILLSAIVCLHAAREAEWLDAVRIGKAATWATLIISAVSIPLYLYVRHHPDLPHVVSETVADGRFRFHARNALMFASQLTGLSFLSLLGHGQRSRLDRHLSELACVIGTLVVLVLAQARGATMTGLVMAMLAIWYIRPSLGALRTKAALAALAVVAAGFWLATSPGTGSAALARFSSMLNQASETAAADASIGERVAMYRAGWQAFLEHPLRGYGYTQRFEAAVPYFPQGWNPHYTHLHNDYITHMVAAGIPGLLVFLAYLTLPLAILGLTRHPSRDLVFMALAGTILMAGIAATTAILGHDVHTTYFSMLIILTLTVALRDGKKKEEAVAVSLP